MKKTRERRLESKNKKRNINKLIASNAARLHYEDYSSIGEQLMMTGSAMYSNPSFGVNWNMTKKEFMKRLKEREKK